MTNFMRDELGAPQAVDRSTFQAELDALVVPRSRADLRNHGATYRDPWWQHAGYGLLGRWKWILTERHGPDVFSDERLPFAALAEARLQSAKRHPLDLGGINE
jgi:hypothetical protein